MVDHVVLAQLGALDTLAAAVLGAVFVGLGALDEAGVRDGDHHVLFGDQILHVHLAGVRQDARAAFVAVLGHDLVEFVAHDLALALRLGQDVLIIGDPAHELVMLVQDLLRLHVGQAHQLHRQDGVGLDLVDVQELHQLRPGILTALAGTDEVAGAAFDDVQLVLHPMADERVQRQRTRHAIDQRQHVRTEGLLQLRMLVQVVEHHLRHRVALEHQHQALAGAAGGLVAHVRDALDLAVAHGLADRRGQTVGVDLVRQFGDHQAHATLDLLGVDYGAHRDQAATGTVCLFDALVAEDGRAGGEVGALDAGDQRVQQFLTAGVGVVERPVHMLVAMPTAMPEEPLTSRFGKRAGSTVGSWVLPS